MTNHTASAIAYDRAGPGNGQTVVLVHAGIADRRMWEPQWEALTRVHDVVRLDLRGYGDSTERPEEVLSPVGDLLGTLAALDIGRCHLVGASFGAGVCVEAALTQPDVVASLLLAAPGGSLIADEAFPDLDAFVEAEDAALEADDLDAAAAANVAWWVVGPNRTSADVAPAVRELVHTMQRRAFELTAEWDDVEESEMEPSPLERLDAIRVPTLVLTGTHDLDAIQDATGRVVDGIAGARRDNWPDTAHLPSLERPDDFRALLLDWLPQAG